MPARARIPIPTSPPRRWWAAGASIVLDSEAHVYAFDAADGQPVWDKRLAPKNGTDLPTLWGLLGKPNTIEPPQGMGGGVAYDDGKIFVTSGFGVLICMDAAHRPRHLAPRSGHADRQCAGGQWRAHLRLHP